MEYHVLKYLEDKNVVSRTGTPLATVNFRPDTDDLITSLYSESAPQEQDTHHFDSDRIGVQFLTRSPNTKAAYDLAWKIHRNLTALGSLEITEAGETINIIDTHIVNPPTFLENDEKGRAVFTSHYAFRINIGGNLYRKMDKTLTPNG